MAWYGLGGGGGCWGVNWREREPGDGVWTDWEVLMRGGGEARVGGW